MKKQQSLLTLAVAGVAIVFASGCAQSQRSASVTNDQSAAYRWASAPGWAPITDIRQMNKFPLDRNPVISYSTTFDVPVQNPASVDVAVNTLPTFNENLQPGDAFVEAAGAAPGDAGQVKRIIRYTPFSGFGNP
jgi:hypothetical protein